MIQLLTQAADENNENLGQWSLLTTTIVVRLHKPKFRSDHFQRRSFKKRSWYMKTIKWRNKKWRSFYNLKRLQPRRQVKHNSMRQTALNSSSNSCCCYIWTCQSDQEEEEDKSDSMLLSKSNSKLDVLISKANTRSIFSQYSFKVQLLKTEMSLHRNKSH